MPAIPALPVSAWIRRYISLTCLRRAVSLSALMSPWSNVRRAASVAGRLSMKDLRRSDWNSSSGSLVGPAAGGVGGGESEGLASGASTGGAETGAAAPFWERAPRSTSMSCLGEQLALERHLVAPAFQASWTMLVR